MDRETHEQTTKTVKRRAAFGARNHSAGKSGIKPSANARLYAPHLYREALAARNHSGDIDHRPPIGCDVSGPVRRVPIFVTASGPVLYWRNRRRAIAILFSWPLGLMPCGAITFSDLAGPIRLLLVGPTA